MATINPASSMGTNIIYVVRGDGNTNVLDETLPIAVGQTSLDFVTGRGVAIVAGKWVPGCTAALDQPMYYLYAGLDINNLPDTTRTAGMPYSGAAKATAWSCFNHSEFATTGYLTSDTYTQGLPLTISAAASTAGQRGLLCLRTAATQPTYGFVAARGAFTNEHGYPVLDFYPRYLPAVGSLTLRTL